MSLEFNKKLICAPTFVSVKIMDNAEDLNVAGVYLPASYGSNNRLAFSKVLNVGEIAEREYGLKVGDYVMIDRLSTFGHTQPIAVLEYNNVICKTDETKSDYYPLKNMLFVTPDEKNISNRIGGVYVAGTVENKLNIGTIVKVNFDENSDFEKKNFTVGSKIILTKGSDVVHINDKDILIYKKDMIVCKVLEEDEQ